jgi:hypothetical protein
MDFLARREHGQAELIKKLAEKGFDRQVAEQAVNKLAAEGLQSDRRFAESFVQSPAKPTGLRWPARSGSRSSVAPNRPISRTKRSRCVFFSTAVSSQTRFRLPWSGKAIKS